MDSSSLKTSVLYAIHRHIAVRCKATNEAFLKCKQDHADPKNCLEQGKQTMDCVNKLYAELQAKGGRTLDAYCDCMDYYTYKFESCVDERKKFEELCPVGSV